ncbi:MAG: tetratricopeptide repeat protein [Myxococcales bacterium]|nr:tetratricopeptide repeat protein [Myxococcales bacterium]
MHRFAICVGLLLAACAGAAPLPPKAIQLNDQGTQALAEGDLETASARFEVALEYNPHFVEALTNLGLVELQRGNFTRARTLLARAKRLNPDVAQPHHGLGVLEERKGRPDIASRHYQEALKVDPGFAPARANLARLYFNAADFERARSQFKRLTEVDPDELLGFTGLCESLLSLGRTAEADAVSRRALSHFGPEPELILLEGRRLLRKGEPTQAIQLLLPLATAEDSYAAAALSWIATAELERRRPAFAVGAAKRALELEPDAAVAIYCLALGLHALGDASARAWLERADALEPGRPLIRAALAEEEARRNAR